MSIESLEKELEEIESKMRPLRGLQRKRERQLVTEKSKLFIQERNITKDMVQKSDGDDLPYFQYITVFGDWMVTNSTKPWCVWNGLLYKTKEIISGRMERHPLGRYEDLSL